MIDILKIHSKFLRYSTWKLTKAWRTPISYDSSVGSTGGMQTSINIDDEAIFISLLLVLQLLQENIFPNTLQWLLLKRENDIFNDYNINHNKRCLHSRKIRNRIGLKRYLMGSSSCLLLNLLFWFVKVSLTRKAIVVLLKKRAAGCFRN